MIPQVSPGPLGDDIMDALVQFHVTYGCPIRPMPVARPDEYELRLDLLREEWCEYVQAVEQGDVVEVADALADMVYVIFGTALSYGIDLPAVLAEVHRSNMSKVGEDGLPVLREDGKILKGPHYFRPNIAAVLGDQARIQHATVLTGGSAPETIKATADSDHERQFGDTSTSGNGGAE